MTEPKLTPRQWELLQRIVNTGSLPCYDRYKPALALQAKGLAVISTTWSQTRIEPTAAGVELVKGRRG